jgi:hypothetical protein
VIMWRQKASDVVFPDDVEKQKIDCLRHLECTRQSVLLSSPRGAIRGCYFLQAYTIAATTLFLKTLDFFSNDGR